MVVKRLVGVMRDVEVCVIENDTLNITVRKSRVASINCENIIVAGINTLAFCAEKAASSTAASMA